MSLDVTLPNGDSLPGVGPIVIIGPNGSGKTRLAHQLAANGVSIEFVNALRNTRVSPEIPAMAVPQARNNLRNAKDQSRSTHWELTNDFDHLLAKLQAEDAQAAIEFRDCTLAGDPIEQGKTAMQRVRSLWSEVFPGRMLTVRDNAPLIKNEAVGEYSGNTMSDGEKAALYLAGHVINAEPGILVVDEPETHFHSLLATRFWDALEDERPDLRFVYITHDLAFARSRRSATLVMAGPTDGLRVLKVNEKISANVTELILGVASLSFHAKRIVICEGEEHSVDAALFRAWFSGRDTEVQGVGSCDQVMQCATAMQTSGLVSGLEVVGIIDRDFHPSSFLDSLPNGVSALPFHEVESLYSIPAIVAAVARHLGREGFDEAKYIEGLRGTVTDAERHKVIVERWKRSLEPRLQTLLAQVSARGTGLDTIVAEIPTLFDQEKWSFNPREELERQKELVESVVPRGEVVRILEIMPGKGLCAFAATAVGLHAGDYRLLINSALQGRDERLRSLGTEIEGTLVDFLPPRSWQPSPPAETADQTGGDAESELVTQQA